MFCHKCGTQIAEGAGFCHKCGTKVVDGEDTIQTEDTTPELMPEQIISNIPVQTNEADDFKEFVDNHVRTNTKFQSAEELLNSRVPQKFMWICFGIPAILGLIAGGPLLAVLFGLFFGYPAVLLTDFMKGSNVTVAGPVEKTNGKIDSDNLVQFLNEQMSYLSPHFHEWGYINYSGFGVRGAATAHTLNSVTASAIKIGTEFGQKRRCFVVIWIESDGTDSDSGGMKYYFRTSAKSAWPSKYLCMVKTVPVLQAVMEYYLKQYKGN